MATGNFISKNLGDLPIIVYPTSNEDWTTYDDAMITIVNENFARSLEYVDVALEPGYYASVQWIFSLGGCHCYDVEEYLTDFEPDERDRIRSLIDADITTIHTIIDKYKLWKLRVSARFSNGETWYERI